MQVQSSSTVKQSVIPVGNPDRCVGAIILSWGEKNTLHEPEHILIHMALIEYKHTDAVAFLIQCIIFSQF